MKGRGEGHTWKQANVCTSEEGKCCDWQHMLLYIMTYLWPKHPTKRRELKYNWREAMKVKYVLSPHTSTVQHLEGSHTVCPRL